MRLRLRIERNGLPPVQALWPVKDPSCTIAQLFQQINEIFPLEGNTWGYEDYAILQDGYELLHYHVVQDTLKDEDKLVFKPLSFVDLRSRTMTGRDQVSVDGRHLLDGVAFGRPALGRTTRPEINIPPRKKRQLPEEEEEEELVSGNHSGAMVQYKRQKTTAREEGDAAEGLLYLNEASDQDSEEDDEPYDPDAADESDSDEDDSLHDPELAEGEESPQDVGAADASSSASDESSEVSSDSEDDSSSDSSSDSGDSEESWDGLAESEQQPLSSESTKPLTNGVSTPKEKSPPKTNGTSEAKKAVSFAGVPYEGSPATHSRNVRRRDAKKLKYAKRMGEVDQSVTLAQFREMARNGDQSSAVIDPSTTQLTNGHVDVNATTETAAADDAATQPNTVISEAAIPQVTETAETATEDALSKKRKRAKKDSVAPETSAKIEAKRQQLVRAIHAGGIDVDNCPLDGAADEDGAPEEITSKQLPQSVSNSAADPDMTSPPSANTRRAKLDLASSQRLLFSSLGVRVPKTQAEKDATHKKLFESAKRKAVQKEQQPPTTNTKAQTAPAATAASNGDPDAWRSKINLTAVECVDENVRLSEPPFPFHQRWDAQYNRKGKKRASSAYQEGGGKKRKRGKAQQVDEQYDKYNADGYGDALNYDDEEEVEDEIDDEYWEDGALLNGDEEDGGVEEDNFPPLPPDLTTLPILTSQAEANIDDIITFTELAVDETTGWQPQMLARTAKILTLPTNADESLRVQLASRDVKCPEYDEEGNRVYSKFEMPGTVEDGGEVEDPRMRDIKWSNMGVVRVVRRAG